MSVDRANAVSRANPLFVYIKMPGDIEPDDRHERFEEPLQEALEADDLGAVTGGGSMLSAPDSEGECSVLFCGIDVDLYQLDKGLELLRQVLAQLEMPPGTVLSYELNDQLYEEPVLKTRQ
jgi:hypothetical protein